VKQRGGNPINKKNSMKNGIWPIGGRQFWLKKQCSTNIENMLMFTFNSPILLGSLNTGSLMNDAMRSIKIIKHKFWTIISSDIFGSKVNWFWIKATKFLTWLDTSYLDFKRMIHRNLLWSSKMVRKYRWPWTDKVDKVP